MSSNTLELIAKFKDNASQGLRRLMNETERSASAQGRAWAQASRQRQQAINAYQRLGIRSEQQIRREIQLTQAAYNRLARSGTLSQRELARAAEANRQNIRRLNSELRSSSGQMGRWQRMMRGGGRAFDAVTRGGAALMAGGYVLAQPVRRTMDYDTELRHVTNVAYAGKSMAERQAGMADINRAVMGAAYEGAARREDTLAAFSTLISSGAVDGQSAQRLLPTIMKTATAANASGEEVSTFIAKALQAGFKEADIPELLDRAVQSGADGGFEFKDMARWLPQQLAAMKNAGMAPTLENFSSLLNANQLSFMSAGSTDEAGNNVVNLLAKLTSPDIANHAKRININGQKGFDFTASMNKRQADGMNSLDAVVDIARELIAKDERSRVLMDKINAAKGDEAKLELLESQKALVDGTAIGQLVTDRQALMALLALVNNADQANRLKQGQANASGAVAGNFDFLMQGSGLQAQRAKAAYSDAEYGVFKGMSDKIGSGMDALGRWAKQNPTQAQVATGAGWTAAAAAAGRGVLGFIPGGSGWAGNMLSGAAKGTGTLLSGAAKGAADLGRGAFKLGGKALTAAPRFNFGLGLLLHSQELNAGEIEEVARMRRSWQQRNNQPSSFSSLFNYPKSLRAANPFLPGDAELGRMSQLPPQRYGQSMLHSPLNSPELQKSAEQIQQSSQTYQQSSEQYAQAVNYNQQAAAQFLEASRLMGTAAGQLAAAARQPVPVTVSVSGGNITAAVSQAAERDNRRN